MVLPPIHFRAMKPKCRTGQRGVLAGHAANGREIGFGTMSDNAVRVYASAEEAQLSIQQSPTPDGVEDKRTVYEVSDPQTSGRTVYVVERTHPLARATAAHHWGFTCTLAFTKSRNKPTPVSRAQSALSRLSAEERQAVLAALSS